MPSLLETLQESARSIAGTAGCVGEDLVAALRILQGRGDGHLSELLAGVGGFQAALSGEFPSWALTPANAAAKIAAGLMTFSRGSIATQVTVDGTLTTVASGVLRVADYSDGTSPGIKIEPQATNLVTNSQASGGAVGTLPTGWSFANAGGLSYGVVGVGVEDGINYVDVRFSGTTTNAQGCNIDVAPATLSVASSTSYVRTCYLKLQAGSFAGVTSIWSYCDLLNSSSAYIGNLTSIISNPTSARLGSQRYSAVGTTSATTAKLTFRPFWAQIPTGASVDFTLRVGAPQLETGTEATSYIPTSGSQVTRGADVLSVPTANITGWNASEGTFVANISAPLNSSAGGVLLLNPIAAGTYLAMNNASGAITGWYFGGSSSAAVTVGKKAIAFNSTGLFDTAALGGNYNHNTTSDWTGGSTTLVIGQSNNRYLDGSIYSISYYPKALPATTLQALTK